MAENLKKKTKIEKNKQKFEKKKIKRKPKVLKIQIQMALIIFDAKV